MTEPNYAALDDDQMALVLYGTPPARPDVTIRNYKHLMLNWSRRDARYDRPLSINEVLLVRGNRKWEAAFIEVSQRAAAWAKASKWLPPTGVLK